MSAFMVGATHIDAMLTAGLELIRPYGPMRWRVGEVPEDAHMPGEPWGPGAHRVEFHELTRETAGTVGAMLLAENRASVNHRYAEDEWEEVYEFRPLRGKVDPVVVLKALDCYEYQSCEHPEWETSEAHAFCAALRSACIHRLPGYEDAPGWEVRDRNVFLRIAEARS